MMGGRPPSTASYASIGNPGLSSEAIGGGGGSSHGVAQGGKQKKKKDDKAEQPYHFPRRSEALAMDKLRATVRELQADVERLNEANVALGNQLLVREEQLKEATDKLVLQKMAWITAQQSSAASPSLPAHPSRTPSEEGWRRSDGPENDTPTNFLATGKEASRPPTSSTAPTRPASARPAAQRPASAKVPQLSGKGMPWGDGGGAQQRAAERPLTARPAAHGGEGLGGGASARQPARPNTARPRMGRTLVVPPVMGGKAPVFTNFPNGKEGEEGGKNEGQLSFGSFAARREYEAQEAAKAVRGISEQSASWESLGVMLQCAWTEVRNGTKGEPAPNFFRLAVCCSIFDKVCGVVGNYSGLLLELRREMYACLFKGFDPEAPIPEGHCDYARMLPFFGEFQRLEAERGNAKRTVERVKRLSNYATMKRAGRLESMML